MDLLFTSLPLLFSHDRKTTLVLYFLYLYAKTDTFSIPFRNFQISPKKYLDPTLLFICLILYLYNKRSNNSFTQVPFNDYAL